MLVVLVAVDMLGGQCPHCTSGRNGHQFAGGGSRHRAGAWDGSHHQQIDGDRRSTRLNSSHGGISRMPSSA